MRKAVLIAHYNKPVEWISEINKDIEIYLYTTNKDVFKPLIKKRIVDVNKGMDANLYLNYIIDNYDNLPDKILFLHHHENDWTQEYKAWEIVNNINWNLANYFSVGAKCNYWYCIPNNKDYHIKMMKDYWYLFEKYIPYPNELKYIAGTQFCVSRGLILQYPKEYYQYLLDFLYTTSLDSMFSGRLFEYVWHYLFTHEPIEVLYEREKVFNNLEKLSKK